MQPIPHDQSRKVFQNIAKAYSAYVTSKPIPKKPAAPTIKASKIALPTEHGGWGFLFEPIVAGLAIAFSITGVWIAVMTIGAFLIRQPLKVLVVDRMGMRVPERAKVALKFVAIFGLVFAAGLAGAVMTGGWAPLMPFAFVLPLATVQMYYDFSRQSRHVLPELGGAVAISASAAAIALAAGFSWPASLALWAVFVARLIPSILYVRERLLLEKSKPFSKTRPLIAHVIAAAMVALLASFGLVPALASLAMLILLGRAVEGLSGRQPMKAMKVGIFEVIYGTITVIAVIVGYYTGI